MLSVLTVKARRKLAASALVSQFGDTQIHEPPQKKSCGPLQMRQLPASPPFCSSCAPSPRHQLA